MVTKVNRIAALSVHINNQQRNNAAPCRPAYGEFKHAWIPWTPEISYPDSGIQTRV